VGNIDVYVKRCKNPGSVGVGRKVGVHYLRCSPTKKKGDFGDHAIIPAQLLKGILETMLVYLLNCLKGILETMLLYLLNC
jgi:hypothetical protein